MTIELDIDHQLEAERARAEANEAVVRARRTIERTRTLLLTTPHAAHGPAVPGAPAEPASP